MKDKNKIPEDRNIIDLPIEAAMPENYLPYAVDVAKDRALPDVRDGLKPVHRRILYGAYLLKAFPDRPYFKSARIVGDIMGKFHPHGDSSIYDAMSILAQDFSTRVPLIEGQGNWGSQDGDPAAAMRYTEARLSKPSMVLLKEIDMDTVDFSPNYSDTEVEPDILPSRFPNLLINGSFGIAVGLSTNIPPHNPGEALDAVCALIDNPHLQIDDLLKYIKGPDLPTGGIIIGGNSLKAAYESGEGKCILRAKSSLEKLDNGRLAIVITEFPYRKNKARILQTISEMTGDRKHMKQLEAISEIRDESGRIGIRAVIELKKNTSEEEGERIRLYLLKKTDLQSNLNFNMVAIDKGKPVTFNLKTMLEAYIVHQREIVTRRTKKELKNARDRFHIVEGFIKAIDVMDELIKTIRGSKNKKDALENIVEKFSFTENQATAILELMLYRLTGLELNVFLDEFEELKKKIKNLEAILANEKKLDALIKKELMDVKKEIDDPRRTKIIEDEEVGEINVEELIVIEDSIVTVSKEGFMKKVALKSYNRSSSDINSVELREGDEMAAVLKTNTNHNLYLFTDEGNIYKIKSQKIPEMKWKDKGIRIDELMKCETGDNEKFLSVFSLETMSDSAIFKFFTDRGNVKRTLGENLDSKYTKTNSIKLGEDEKVLKVVMEEGNEIIDNSIDPVMESKKESEATSSSEDEIKSGANEEDILFEIRDGEEFNEEVMEDKAIPGFIKIETKAGLSFTVADALCEVKDKRNEADSLAIIPPGDRIARVSYKGDYEVKEVTFTFNEDKICPLDKEDKARRTKEVKLPCATVIEALSTEEILFLFDDGTAIRLPAYNFESLKGPINLKEVLDLHDDKRVVDIIVLDDNYIIEKEILLVTSQGSVKRTLFNDFKDPKGAFPVFKFRNKGEKLVRALVVENPEDTLTLFTQKAMGIRFIIDNVSTMGRIASGVVGISLREEDRVIYGEIQKKDSNDSYTLKTDKGSSFKLEMPNFKIQNRAGKGVRLGSLVLNEIIKEIHKKEGK